MRSAFLLIILLGVSHAESPKPVVSDNKAPAYKVLFENGFYKEAIEYLEQQTKNENDPEWLLHRQYLAFCYVLTEQSTEAGLVFQNILRKDPGYRLGPLEASPEIYAVFVQAIEKWEADGGNLAAVDSVAAVAGSQAVTSPVPSRSWKEAGLCLLPGGAGQFRQNRRLKGSVLLAAEVIQAGLFIWAYHEYNNAYDPARGWTAENYDRGQQYLAVCRLQIGLFTLTHLYGAVDALFLHRAERP